MTDYPYGMTLRPIEQWPFAFTKNRRRAPFSATLTTTISQLDVELRNLGTGRRAPSVLQIAMREQDFRLRDGMPRAHAVPEHPGVILAIDSRHGPLSYPCDTFTRWQDNLRAITLGLEALRRVERYGITQTGQQYRGWQALEAASTADAAAAAWKVLIDIAALAPDEFLDNDALYRRARANAHPDRHGGDQTLWDHVQSAANVIGGLG